MKVIFALGLFAVISMLSLNVVAQEYSDDEEDFEPVQAEVIDRSQLSKEAIADGDTAYVILYNRKHFKGFSRQIWLRDGSQIALHRCRRLHDNVRSIKLVAPRHAAIVLLEKALITYANQKEAVWWGWGLNQKREIDKRDLTHKKMFRQASALRFLYDGYYWSNEVQYVTC
jgi:hypothetical protein